MNQIWIRPKPGERKFQFLEKWEEKKEGILFSITRVIIVDFVMDGWTICETKVGKGQAPCIKRLCASSQILVRAKH
jgi:hypothetical protein